MLIFILAITSKTNAQSLSRMPDSVRKVVDQNNGVSKGKVNLPIEKYSEDEIKSKLIKLALQSAQLAAADANISIAEIERRKANSSLLSSVNFGGNVNEFVINNSPAASFFPKYNFGLSISLDAFAKNKAEKKTADQMIIFNKSQKEQLENNIRAKVLIQYELYKEKKELVQLQKIAMEEDVAAYEKAQNDFQNDEITMEELNKLYKATITEKALLFTKEKDLNIAIIQIEELIGMSLEKALQ
jgi:outer membrane protein TolC